MFHLRYAGLSDREQRSALEAIIGAMPVLMDVLERLRGLDLPDAWLTSGAIYNTVWNHLTGPAGADWASRISMSSISTPAISAMTPKTP